jgi:hypothetical protein
MNTLIFLAVLIFGIIKTLRAGTYAIVMILFQRIHAGAVLLFLWNFIIAYFCWHYIVNHIR